MEDSKCQDGLVGDKAIDNYDAILEKVGTFGRYQFLVIWCCIFFPAFASGFATMNINFTLNIPNHWCLVPSADHLNLTREEFFDLTAPKGMTESDDNYRCERFNLDYTNWTREDVASANATIMAGSVEVIGCDAGWGYDTSVYPSTAVTDWDLVCDRRHMISTSSSVYMAGIMFGVVCAGLISDRWGRRMLFYATYILSTVCTLLSAASPNYWFFLVTRFFVGAGFIGVYTSGYILAMEIVGPKWRPLVGAFVGYFWSASLVLMPWLAYFTRAWRHVILATSAPLIIGLIGLVFVPESPRWLYTQNKHQLADAIVRKIAKLNGRELNVELRVIIKDTKSKANLLDILKQPILRIRLLALCLMWCCIAMVYYAILLNASRFEGNDFVNFSIGGAVELASVIFATVVLKFLPRRVNIGSVLLGAGVSLLAIVFTPTHLNGVVMTLVMIGRFCMTTAFFSIYVVTAEVFPTVVRAVGISTCSFTARVGGIVAPFIGALIGVNRIIPFMVFGVASLVGSVLTLLLPETKDKRLPETLDDGENMGGLWCLSGGGKGLESERSVNVATTEI